MWFSSTVIGYYTIFKYDKIVLLIPGITRYGINVQEDYINAIDSNSTSTGVPANNIPITGLTLTNITGTMSPNAIIGVPVYILCAVGGCFDFNWSNISITGGVEVKSSSCNFSPSGDYSC